MPSITITLQKRKEVIKMPPLGDHFKSSKERTGNAYEELHHWIDDNKTNAPEIHDLAKIHENIAYVREQWGGSSGSGVCASYKRRPGT